MWNIKIFLHIIEISLLFFFLLLFLFFPYRTLELAQHVTFLTMIFCFLLDINDSLSLKNLVDNGEMDLFHHLNLSYLVIIFKIL